MYLGHSDFKELLGAIFFIFSVQATHAAQLDLTELPLEQLLEVNVTAASKFEQRVSDAPSAVQIINREEIERHGWRTLTEAINTLPGIYSVNDHAYDYIGARGFQIPGDYNTRFLLLVDGQRNNDNIYQQALTGSEGWLDMSAVERIEYIPGPGSAIYGSNAMFGVINVITRRAGQTPFNQVSTHVSQLGLTSLSAMTSHPLDDGGGLMLQFSTEHQTGRDQTYSDPQGKLIRANNTVSPDGVAHGLDSASNRHLMVRLDHDELSLKLIHHERTVSPSSAAYGTVFDDSSFKINDGGTQLHASVRHQTSESASVLARVAYSDWHYRATYPYLDPGLGYFRNYDDTRGQSLEGEFSLDCRVGSHHVITGLDFAQDLLARQQNFNSVPAALLNTVDVNINPLVKRRGLFVQDEWRVAPAWLLSLGLRMDSATYSQSSSSPRLGLIWQPTPDWTAKLLTGRAYRSPNAFESQFGNGMTNLSNPTLRPETIQTTEGVVEWIKNEKTRWLLSLFDNKIDHFIHQVDTTGTGLLQFQNGSWSRVQGLELGVETVISNSLRMNSSFAYNSSSTALHANLDNSPFWLGKLSVHAPAFGNNAFLAGEIQAIGNRNFIWNATPYSVGSDVLANASVTFPNVLTRGLQAQLRCINLLNRQLQYPASAEMPTPTTLGNGRNISANISYEF